MQSISNFAINCKSVRVHRLLKNLQKSAKENPTRRFDRLYQWVCHEELLTWAFHHAEKNDGNPGSDGQTFGDIRKQGVRPFLLTLQQDLLSGTYWPHPLRQSRMPKKDGSGYRPLSIPSIRDRVAQTSAKLILEAIIEADLSDCCHAYRPKRSHLMLIKEIQQDLSTGTYQWAVRGDIYQYFQWIIHSRLMDLIKLRIADRRLLALLWKWLKSFQTDNGIRMGLSQGSPISNILANLYLTPADYQWLNVLGKLFRYSDDYLILCRTHQYAVKALKKLETILDEHFLALNSTKTGIFKIREGFTYLRASFTPYGNYRNLQSIAQDEIPDNPLSINFSSITYEGRCQIMEI